VGLVSGPAPNVPATGSNCLLKSQNVTAKHQGKSNAQSRNIDPVYLSRLSCRSDRDGFGMSGFADVVREFWAIIMAGVAGLVWLVRLESRSLAIEKELQRMAEQRVEDLANAAKSREDQKETLAEMKDDMKTIRQDIKTLLSRHH
jgi:hypothetical protein